MTTDLLESRVSVCKCAKISKVTQSHLLYNPSGGITRVRL